MMNITELQTALAAMYGPAGREMIAVKAPRQSALEGIRALAEPYADEICSDAMGNLIARKAGGGKKIMLCAHMDTIGLIVTHIEEGGFLRFASLGGVNPHRLLDTLVVFPDGTKGVVAWERGKEIDKLTLDKLYIDIGAASREDAQTHVKVGDAAVFDARTFAQNGRLFSTYLDDRIGCAVLLQALARVKAPKNDLYFVFSTQEEVGIRGAGPAAFGIMPDYCIAVDVTLTGDVPEPGAKLHMKLGGGAAVKHADSSVICHPRAVRWLEDAARSNNIPFQVEVLIGGGTDTSVIQRTGLGTVAGAVSIPSRCVHGVTEIADLGDLAACVDLICAAVNVELP